MISLSAPTYDTQGALICPTGYAVLQSPSRRASRIATLDGGATLVDGGWSDADRTYKLTIPSATRAQRDSIIWLMTYHSTAILSCSDGCFSVLISALSYSNGKATLTAEVLEALSWS
jgi:hypothetical protein